MPAGRSTECDQDAIDKALDYVSDDVAINYQSHGHAIPSVVGMCRVLNRARSTLYKWAEDKEGEFSDILANNKEFQELVTLNKTLTGDLNAQIGKLVLGKHGYHEKMDTKIDATVGLTDKSDEEITRLRQALELSRDKARRE